MKKKTYQSGRLPVLFFAAVLLAAAVAFLAAGKVRAEASGPVIFISDNSVGTGTGASAADPLQADEYTSSATTEVERAKATALYKAWETLMEAGGGTIVICGEYEITKAMTYTLMSGWSDYNMQMPKTDAPDRNVTITYTSVYDGVDYRETNDAKIVLAEGQVHLAFPTATVTENISFQAKGTNNYISAGTCDLTLSTGTNFLKYANVYPTIIGNYHRGDQFDSNYPTHITVDIGEGNTVGDIYGQSKFPRAAQQSSTTIDIKSGTVGNIYGDSYERANASYGPFTINISGGTVEGEICGTKMGFNASSTTKTVTINVSGGDFSACTAIIAAKTSVASANAPTSTIVDMTDLTNAATFNTVKSLITDESVTIIEPSYDPTVIFIADNSVGTGTGTSAGNPLQADEVESGLANNDTNRVKATALYKAWETLRAAGGGTIVICGEYEITQSMCFALQAAWTQFNMMMPTTEVAPKKDVTITYTSVYNGIDYRETNGAKVVLAQGGLHLTFPTSTVTENISFQAKGTVNYLSAGACSLTLSNGTNILPYANTYMTVLGNFHRGDQADGTLVNVPTEITIDLGEGNAIGDVYGQSLQSRGSQQSSTTITLKSGTVKNIYGDSVNNVGCYGPITINIEGGEVEGLIAGVGKGFNASSTTRTVTINISGGDFSSCTGVLGAATSVSSANAPTSTVIDAMEATRETVVLLKEIKESTATLLYKRIFGRSIALSDSIAVKVLVDLDDLSDAAAFEATVDGTEVEIESKTENTDGSYTFVFRIDPSMLADEIVVTLTEGDETLDTASSTVVEYCEAVAEANSGNAKMMTLIADLLEYGAAAQTYVNHNTDKLANTSAWVAANKSEFTAPTATDKSATGTGDEGAKIRSAYLNLYDIISVRFKLNVTDTEGLSVKLLKNGTETDAYEVKDGFVEVRSNGTAASEVCDAVYTLVLLRSGSEIQRAVYSAKSYVYSNANASDAALAAIVQRMWCYGTSAKAYVA